MNNFSQFRPPSQLRPPSDRTRANSQQQRTAVQMDGGGVAEVRHGSHETHPAAHRPHRTYGLAPRREANQLQRAIPPPNAAPPTPTWGPPR